MLRRSARIGTGCRTAALITRARSRARGAPPCRVGADSPSQCSAHAVSRVTSRCTPGRAVACRVGAVDSAAPARILSRVFRRNEPCPRGVVTFSSRHAATKRRSSAGRWTASRAQSIPPASWIVVDDGSTDETPAILAEYAARLPYLRIIRRDDRGRRSVGPGVVEAFYAGLEGVDLGQFDYLCKLDMDLDLPPRYFEGLMHRMEAEPRLGTTSGKPWFVHPRSNALVPEVCGDEMSVGMTKFYRVDVLPGDRRLRPPGDVGRHRLPPGADAGLDGRERRRRAASLRPPPAAGREPEGDLDRTGTGRIRSVLHGDLAAVLPGGGGVAAATAPGVDRERGHALGLLLQRSARGSIATTTPTSAGSCAGTSTSRCWWASAPRREGWSPSAPQLARPVIRVWPAEPSMPEATGVAP